MLYNDEYTCGMINSLSIRYYKSYFGCCIIQHNVTVAFRPLVAWMCWVCVCAREEMNESWCYDFLSLVKKMSIKIKKNNIY